MLKLTLIIVFRLLVLLLITFYTSVSAQLPNVNLAHLEMLQALKKSNVDPCLDYYQHACGNWHKLHESKPYATTLELVDYAVNEDLADLLDNGAERHTGKGKSLRQLTWQYYTACLNVKDNYDPQRYLDWLSHEERKYIIWPMLLLPAKHHLHQQSNCSNHYDWLQMLAVLRRYGFNGVLLEETVLQQQHDAQHWYIDVDKPTFNGGFQVLAKWQFLHVVKALGHQIDVNVEQLWQQIKQFESKLLELNESTLETESEVIFWRWKNLNEDNLLRYLNLVLELDRQPPHVFDDLTVQLHNAQYIRSLQEMLNSALYTDEFICRYLMLRFIWYLDVNSPLNFERNECVASTRNALPYAIAWLHEQHAPELVAEMPHIERIFHMLRQEFNYTLLSNANNFDDGVLHFLQHKLAHMQLKINNLPRPQTTKRLVKFYASLLLSADNYYANQLLSLRHTKRALHAQLIVEQLTPYNNVAQYFHIDESTIDGSSSTPYFLQRSNLIVVPLTLLNPPLYDRQLHSLFKYSALGFLMAHELMHGFDDSGIHYDEYGNSSAVMAERIRSNAVYDQRLRCLSARNPNILDEKIADISGLRLSYETYFRMRNDAKAAIPRWTKTDDRNSTTIEHLFFQNFAMFFCYSAAGHIDISSHGDNRERVLNAVNNFDEFQRVYACPKPKQTPRQPNQSSGNYQHRSDMRRVHQRQSCELWGQ